MKYELINLTAFPSMAAPWSSQDEGETWVWGNFFCTMQKKPQSISDGIMAMTGQRTSMPGGIIYHYAVTVFYNKDKNPHGPSSRPVLSLGIEQLMMDGIDSGMPLVVGLFKSGVRLNLGNYNGNLTAEDVLDKFFSIIKSELKLNTEPQKIGTMKDAWGHPLTGWENHSTNHQLIKPLKSAKKPGLFSKLTDFFS